VRIEAITPTSLLGVVNTEVLPVPTVQATNEHGQPVPGLLINFETGISSGVIAHASVATDANGLATVGVWRLGTIATKQTLVARSNGQVRAEFTAQAAPGPVAQITRLGGHDQLATVRATLPQRLGVRVADAFDNPIVGAAVTFTVVSGNGDIDGRAALTDALGVAFSERWTLGPLPGVQQVSARSAHAEVVFSAASCACSALLFVRNHHVYRTIDNFGQQSALTSGQQPVWSPDGQRIAFSRFDGLRYDIYLMNADGSNIVRRTSSGGNEGNVTPGYHSPAWSPDGRWLAVASGGTYEGFIYLVSMTDPGQEPRIIKGMATQPAWSPDGSKIAFVRLSGDDGYHALDVMDADGTNVREVTSPDPAVINHPTWSPDGRRIAFAKCLNGLCDIYAVGWDGSGLRRLTNGRIALSPVWSPDGAWIAFTLLNTWAGLERREWIAAVPADTGGTPSTIIDGGTQPAWRPSVQEPMALERRSSERPR
jgi:Tol biopolymer transport system component